IIFMGIFLFLLIPFFIMNLIDTSSILYGPLNYLLKAVGVILAIPIFLYLSDFILESQRKEIIVKEDISPAKGHLMLYKISKGNFKYQILFGTLLLFLVFIPLDFFTYFFIPDMLEFSANALIMNSTNAYLQQEYLIFLGSAIVIHISVAIYEETVVRGFLTIRGSKYFQKISAVFIASLYFGLGHFAYLFNPISTQYPLVFPFIWFVQTFFVGVILSLIVLNKKWLFPVIFAHSINNIISAHAIWNFLQGNQFEVIAIYLYIPLLIVGIILFVWQFSRIKESILIGLKELRSYAMRGEFGSDKAVIVLVDLIIGLLIFLVGVIII
ncbi:unnamed protein product, partial [marine sediment metagenome]